ncbi:MAG: L-threonylcarbamoyladenylate synthase [Bacillota bacterium]
MSTLYLKVDPRQPEPLVIAQAANILRHGGLVAFPTETVYGLGANALDAQAVAGIFRAKGRPADNPLIVHIANLEQLSLVAGELPARAKNLVNLFWPGPLTLVLPKNPQVPAEVTAGLDTVAIRMPSHPVALALIQAAGVPLAAPSANRSGAPSPTTAGHVIADLDGRIHAVVDGGPAYIGLESTVLDLAADPPLVLRPGGVTVEQLEDALQGPVAYEPALSQLEQNLIPRSPGMKYTHYAPQGEVFLVSGSPEAVREKVQRLLSQAKEHGQIAAVLSSKENLAWYQSQEPMADLLINLGPRSALDLVAQNLYGALRACDEAKAAMVLVEAFPATGLGLAVMNRLYKAASCRMIEA